jgi:UDP-N-acetylmuramoyl-tripeptide--D-alanyl-D-alanine ligase
MKGGSVLTVSEVAALVGGRLEGGEPGAGEAPVAGVSIDSRTLRPGELFFAIIGAHRNGHDFVGQALERGACGLVVSAPDSGGPREALRLRVEDTTAALQGLARAVRDRADIKVVAITGSMGKTTTKEATAAALSARFRVLKTEGNLNNLYGLPLTLLRLLAGNDEQAAVVELGMSAPGEIARLTEIARPDVGVLTNVAEVHREFFPSLEAIAAAKGELFAGLAAEAVAVVNADDPLALGQARRFLGRRLAFGLSPNAEIRAESIERTPDGMRFAAVEGVERALVQSALFGRHQVHNLLAALAAARALGLTLHEASAPLAAIGPGSHRGERLRYREGFLLIDETYNSNPAALSASLLALGEEPAVRRIAVLGDMLELGERAEPAHLESGARVAASGIDLLVGVGSWGKVLVEGARRTGMPEPSLLVAASAEEAGEVLAGILRAGDVVLLKASRGVALERALETVNRRFTQEPA